MLSGGPEDRGRYAGGSVCPGGSGRRACQAVRLKSLAVSVFLLCVDKLVWTPREGFNVRLRVSVCIVVRAWEGWLVKKRKDVCGEEIHSSAS
ncbi:hypothetical protein E2C01_061928 [Portunus trituberculatus]|uniref:Uncharacterized protein n=1 Tax=Portunus trituberculatus TaxID=210409 RepID=A0A5B7HDQ7_PORTR|nr:hypothetical protein [Portunus trituberculatus]